MIKELFHNKVFQFFLKAIGLYIGWFLLYELWLHPAGRLDRIMIDNLIDSSSFLLRAMGYRLIPEPPVTESIRTIGIDGTHGVWIGDPCNGLSLIALFSGFIIAFDGKINHKLWFIPLGALSLHLLNIIRIVALCLVVSVDYRYLDFNHTYTFTLISYSWMFFLWIIWANKLSRK